MMKLWIFFAENQIQPNVFIVSSIFIFKIHLPPFSSKNIGLKFLSVFFIVSGKFLSEIEILSRFKWILDYKSALLLTISIFDRNKYFHPSQTGLFHLILHSLDPIEHRDSRISSSNTATLNYALSRPRVKDQIWHPFHSFS